VEFTDITMHSIKDPMIRSLIELGMKGHYPLFEQTWISNLCMEKKLRFNHKEKIITKNIFDKLSGHRGLERKKVILSSINEEERDIFIKAFFKLVELAIIEGTQSVKGKTKLQ
jgi:hypothetical protein